VKTGRASGILLHPTSLAGRFGIGDLGPEALRFADWLAEAGQKIWQVLPLGPVGYGESPYQLFSVFAGNPILISPERLVEQGWLMGDAAIYAAMDSADVWSRPEQFRFDAVAGVPPDYFSATGQLWGNPIYRWDRMRAEGYGWWLARMRAALSMFDLVRLDHFRGFEAYWQVPAGEKTAVRGEWVKGPGADLFRALEKELGRLPLVAENLGVVTAEVEAIRHEFGLPGMAVLQFAFGNDAQADSFKPHNYERNLVAYSGTHDNDTVEGWWRSEGGDSTRTAEEVRVEKARASAYLNTDVAEIHWAIIRALMVSVADTVLFPMQDVLGLGSEARMNTPATTGGNWRWRMRGDATTAALAARLREMAEVYQRSGQAKPPVPP
jgi:4-alpha-glucanotransferase